MCLWTRQATDDPSPDAISQEQLLWHGRQVDVEGKQPMENLWDRYRDLLVALFFLALK